MIMESAVACIVLKMSQIRRLLVIKVVVLPPYTIQFNREDRGQPKVSVLWTMMVTVRMTVLRMPTSSSDGTVLRRRSNI